jgi:quercetin dioxygenase-like cupin family protein
VPHATIALCGGEGMSETRRRYEFPDGSVYDVEVPAHTTAGARTELLVTLAPRAITAPPHRHPSQAQECLVVSGELEALIDRQWRRLRPGESVGIPAGQRHTLRNPTDELSEFRLTHVPSGQLERYLERLYWLSAMNRIRRGRHLSSLLYDSLLWDEHRDDLMMAAPWAQLRVKLLARVARLLRLRVDR